MPTRFKLCPFNTETWHKGLTSLSQPHTHNLTHRILMEIARVSVSHLPGTGEPPKVCCSSYYHPTTTGCSLALCQLLSEGLEMWGFARRTRPASLLKDGVLVAGVMTEKCIRWWKVLGRELKGVDVQASTSAPDEVTGTRSTCSRLKQGAAGGGGGRDKYM